MAVDARSAKGAPIFYGSGADDQAADLTLLGAELYERGTRLILTQAEMDDLVTDGLAFEGLEVFCLDDGMTYVRISSTWKRSEFAETGTVTRNTSGLSLGSAGFSDMGAAFGSDTVTGGVAWSGGFVVPTTGLYEVGFSIVGQQAGGAVYVGITTASGTPGATDMVAGLSVPAVSSIAHVSIMDRIQVASGAKIRAFGITQSGSMTMQVSRGRFDIRRVG